MTQLAASGGATVIATVASARLGVVGTLTGAAVSSVVTTAGAAILRHYLDRGKQTVLGVVTTDVHDAKAAMTQVALTGDPNATRVDLPVIPPVAYPDPAGHRLDPAEPYQPDPLDPQATRLDITLAPMERSKSEESPKAWSWPSWQTLAIAAVTIFALTIGGIVAFEALTGTAVSAGSSGSDSRIVPGLGSADTGTESPTPSTSRTSTPSQSPTQEPSSTPSGTMPSTPTPAPSTEQPAPSPSITEQQPSEPAASPQATTS
jgi:hypothetical protein